MSATFRAVVAPEFVLLGARITYSSVRKQSMLPVPPPTTSATHEPCALRAHSGTRTYHPTPPLLTAVLWHRRACPAPLECSLFGGRSRTILRGGGAISSDNVYVCFRCKGLEIGARALPRSSERESSDAFEYTLCAPGLSAKTEP